MSICNVLDRLETIYRQLVASALSGTRTDVNAVIELRQQFALEYGNFLKSLGEEVDVIEHRALFEKLQEEMETMRGRLMSYQFQWQPAQMARDPEGYLKAARAVAAMVETFIKDTRSSLEANDICQPAETPATSSQA